MNEPREQTENGRAVLWGAVIGLVVVAIVLAILGSPIAAIIAIAFAAVVAFFFIGAARR